MLQHRKLYHDMVFCCNKETMSQHRKLCRDMVFCCNRANYVATEKLRHDRKIMSRQKNYVVTEKLCLDRKNCVTTKTLEKTKKGRNFSSPFHRRTINTHFFRFLGQWGRWENTSHEVSLSKLPIFLIFPAYFDF